MEAEERPAKVRRLDRGATTTTMSDADALVLQDEQQHTTAAETTYEVAVDQPADQTGHRELKDQQQNRDQDQKAPSDCLDQAAELNALRSHADSPSSLPSQPDSKSAETLSQALESSSPSGGAAPDTAAAGTLSKTQLKKQRKREQWEAGREWRKQERKRKLVEKRKLVRAARRAATGEGAGGVIAGDPHQKPSAIGKPEGRVLHEQLPITFVLDCGFDELMADKERVSLASQLTRCYSDNAKARYRVHIALSSFGGSLKERFDGVLMGHYRSWKGVKIFHADEERSGKKKSSKISSGEDGLKEKKQEEEREFGDFVVATERAKQWMREPGGGKLVGPLAAHNKLNEWAKSDDGEQNTHGEQGEVIYLSADSDETITELKPYSTYIIGGLVDRNRHKGICARRAAEKGIRTARLPIGEYMRMNSRYVLATNHVSEIMLKWLECGDWGQAFVSVMPKRKGGELRTTDGAEAPVLEDVDNDTGDRSTSREGIPEKAAREHDEESSRTSDDATERTDGRKATRSEGETHGGGSDAQDASGEIKVTEATAQV